MVLIIEFPIPMPKSGTRAITKDLVLREAGKPFFRFPQAVIRKYYRQSRLSYLFKDTSCLRGKFLCLVFSNRPQLTTGISEYGTIGFLRKWYGLQIEITHSPSRSEPLRSWIQTSCSLIQHGGRVWWTNMASKNLTDSLLSGQLLDNGNFILRSPDELFWQSFDFPTDALISGMKLGWDARTNIDRVLTSWRSVDQPSSGEYIYRVERGRLTQSFIRRKGLATFRSDPWEGVKDVEEPLILPYATYSITATKEEATYVFQVTNSSFFSILRLSDKGVLNRSTWIPRRHKAWKRVGHILPHDLCDSYGRCEANGLCDTQISRNCECIRGFKPRDQEAWGLQDWSGGCVRKTLLNCSQDGFERLWKMKLPDITAAIVDRSIGLKECKDKCIANCNCTAYANIDMQNGGSGCVIWVGEILDLRKNVFGGHDLFVRLAASDVSPPQETKRTINISTGMIVLIVVIGVVLLVGVIFVLFFFWKRKKRIPTSVTEEAAAAPPPIGGLQCAPMELVTVANATENFSDCNKIGQGGFGVVYKGMLPDGKAIAAKRLLNKSAQGIEEFTNEVKLIASVQHINLVQLIGYCRDGDERILVFEYEENSSLDTYIFDKTQSYKLDWEKRLDITIGIARGLVYLHQDSRCRIIHRDLKPSNILLDKDMVPKISDFGLAMLFQRDENEGSTTKRVGTYGYIAPEYVEDGVYSVKSDVFSFGVLVLEIISGKRNAQFVRMNNESIQSHIWRCWKEGKGLDIVDPVIVPSSSTSRADEVLRCIHVGLLCVQESAESRPAMSSVILMLTSEKTEMSQPERPGSFRR